MAPAIEKHAAVLEPLHKAIGAKSKKETIEWSDELLKNFKDAQEIPQMDKLPCVVPSVPTTYVSPPNLFLKHSSKRIKSKCCVHYK